MSEYEVLELLSIYRTEAQAHVMNFVSVLFAFIIAVYLVGEKLSEFQAWFIATLYSLFIPAPIAASIEVFVTLRDLIAQFSGTLSISTGVTGIMSWAYIVVPLIMALGWAMSIIFLIQIRRRDYAKPH